MTIAYSQEKYIPTNAPPILILFILLLLPFTSANVDYNETGNFNTQSQLGNGIFNTNLNPATVAVSTKTVTNARGIQLVSDLDGDGVQEIIIADLPLFRLFSGVGLDSVAGFNTGAPILERLSNIITFDIDGDGFREIIYVEEERELLQILQYNGTSFFNQTTIKLDALPATIDSEFMLKCGETNNCLLTWNEDITAGNGAVLLATGFNSTVIGSDTIVLHNDTVTSRNFCFPKIRTIAYADVDRPSVEFSYVMSAMKFSTSTAETIFLEYLTVEDNLSVTQQFEISDTTSGGDTLNPATGSVNCLVNIMENFYTSPLVFDLEDESDGLETVVGVAKNAVEFKMTSYFNPAISLNQLDDYPEFFEADGQLLSNPFRANVFEDSGNFDFCVLGFEETPQEIDLLCGNEKDVATPETEEFKFSTVNRVNLSQTYRQNDILSHSAQHSSIITGSDDLSEIVNSYGIFTVTEGNPGTLNLIFDNPKDTTLGGALISVDAATLNIPGGGEDLLFFNDNNLFYIDDGRSNTPVFDFGVGSSFTTNPCLDSPWKINTTVGITIIPVDPDGDTVSARAVIYSGDSNVQDSGFSANVSSGTEIPFNFVANKTIGTGAIVLQMKDTTTRNIKSSRIY